MAAEEPEPLPGSELPHDLVAACNELLQSWLPVSEWLGHDLLRGGPAAPILSQIASVPRAATILVSALMDADELVQRKLGATLLGFVRSTDPDDLGLLAEVFDRERARDREAAQDGDVRLNAQSVVEDIVFAAIRWTETNAQRGAGQALLRSVVEATIGGEYWNSAVSALAALVEQRAQGWQELLDRFTAFASGPPPIHPCRPSLAPEKALAMAVKSGDRRHFASLDRLLRIASSRTANLDGHRTSMVAALLDRAKAVDQLLRD